MIVGRSRGSEQIEGRVVDSFPQLACFFSLYGQYPKICFTIALYRIRYVSYKLHAFLVDLPLTSIMDILLQISYLQSLHGITSRQLFVVFRVLILPWLPFGLILPQSIQDIFSYIFSFLVSYYRSIPFFVLQHFVVFLLDVSTLNCLDFLRHSIQTTLFTWV